MKTQDLRFKEISKILQKQKYEEATCFFEFWGKHSFAGLHEPEDEKYLTLIDVAPHRQGILGPAEFLQLFRQYGGVPNYLGIMNYDPGLIKQVWEGRLEGASFEGIVAKAGSRHKLVMAKAKTAAWVTQVKARYSAGEAEKIINS
jgi:hypothetical protein